jgi:hypothetical protein
MISRSANLYTQLITKQNAEIIKTRIIAAFMEATHTSRPNTEATTLWKTSQEFKSMSGGGAIAGMLASPLIATGRLFQAVSKPEISFSEIDVAQTNLGAMQAQSKSMVTIKWSMPDADMVYSDYAQNPSSPMLQPFGIWFAQTRKNPGYSYLFTVEFGARGSNMHAFGVKQWKSLGSIPKRSFLKSGIQGAMRDCLLFTSKAIQAMTESWKELPAPTQFETPSLGMERELRWGPNDLIMMVAPPMNLYAIAGGGLDYLNILKGEFTQRNYEQWIIQMTKGKMGVTRLTQRRRVRKAIWR